VEIPPPNNRKSKTKEVTGSLHELNEVSASSSSVRRKEPEYQPVLHRLDERHHDSEPVHTEQAPEREDEAPAPRKPRQKRTLIATYRQWSPIKRYSLLILGLATGYSLLMGGGKGPPPADFTREVTSLKKLEKEGKVAEAIQKGELLSKKYDRDPNLFVTLGELYASQKRFEQAIQSYRKAKSIDPDHPVATVRLIALFLRTGLAPEAESQMQDLDRMMKEGKHSRELFVEAANLFLEFRELTRSPDKALILSRALQNELAIDSTIGYKLEAQLQFQQNQNEEAMKTIEKGLQRDPQDEWLLENLAFAKLSLQDAAGATEVVENWIRIHPTATKALLVMAYMKYKEKNYLGALPYLQKIVQIGNSQTSDPLIPEALNLMGQIYYNQGQTAEARSLLAQACQEGYTQACGHEVMRSPQSTKDKAATAAPEAAPAKPEP
jgi:tetratricopeptide (TPR) repeat protein